MKKNVVILISGIMLALCPFPPTAQAGIEQRAAAILDTAEHKRDITADIAWIRANWDHLGPETKARFRPFCLNTPLGSNAKQQAYLLAKTGLETDLENVNVIKTDHFRIIWGKDYKEHINKMSSNFMLWGDSDQDGVPYSIEKLAGTDPYTYDGFGALTDYSSGFAEYVWQREIEDMGFLPPLDSEDYYLDIYIANTGVQNEALDADKGAAEGVSLPDQVYGLTSTYSSSGQPYVILNQDLNLDTLKVTLAHEFFHAIQLSYIPYTQLLQDLNLWLAEGTATWMEDALYPEVNDYKQYVNQWVNYPQKSLFATGSEGHLYGSVIFFKYLSQYYHEDTDPEGGQVIRSIWSQAQDKDPVQAIQAFLENQTVNANTSLQTAYTDFALKNLDFSNYYVDGSLYQALNFSTLALIPEKDVYEDLSYSPYDSKSPSHYGSAYLECTLESGWELDQANRLALDFLAESSPAGTNWHLFFVFEETDGTRHIFDASEMNDGQMTFNKPDPVTYTKAYLVISAVPDSIQDLDPSSKNPFSCSLNSYLATRLTAGWNLNGLRVDSVQAQDYGINSIWAWDQDAQNWQMDLPGTAEETMAAYLGQKGFAKLAGEAPGQGAWYHLQQNQVEVEPESVYNEETLLLQEGWNLLANPSLTPLTAESLATHAWCESIWKWDSLNSLWRVFLPGLDQEASTYLQQKGFAELEKIYFDEGFWLNSSSGNQEIVFQ